MHYNFEASKGIKQLNVFWEQARVNE